MMYLESFPVYESGITHCLILLQNYLLVEEESQGTSPRSSLHLFQRGGHLLEHPLTNPKSPPIWVSASALFLIKSPARNVYFDETMVLSYHVWMSTHSFCSYPCNKFFSSSNALTLQFLNTLSSSTLYHFIHKNNVKCGTAQTYCLSLSSLIPIKTLSVVGSYIGHRISVLPPYCIKLNLTSFAETLFCSLVYFGD